ncbi:MAG: crotonobetainyl-CoA:carnitine CoA-transferase CaiB-like acyl-CoA transferase, partial [Gammaproteobacteria bacterium]
TPTAATSAPAYAGQHTDEALAQWGFDNASIAALKASGAARQR